MIRLHKYEAVEALLDTVDDMELEDIKIMYKGYLRKEYEAMDCRTLAKVYNEVCDPQEAIMISSETDMGGYGV